MKDCRSEKFLTRLPSLRCPKQPAHFRKGTAKVLPESLAAFGITYEHIAGLGGLRGKAHDIPPTLDRPELPQLCRLRFVRGISQRLEQACVPRQARAVRRHVRRCRRRIIADYLISHGEIVFHLMRDNNVEPAKLSDGVRARFDGTLFYPPSCPLVP